MVLYAVDRCLLDDEEEEEKEKGRSKSMSARELDCCNVVTGV